MSKTSDTTMAFLMGVLTGGVIALLMAPDKGEVTRERIRRGANDAYGRGRGWVDTTQGTIRTKANEYAGRARERAQGVADAARGQVDAVRGAVSEGKEAYRREMEGGQEEEQS